jgi:hypothetical protein
MKVIVGKHTRTYIRMLGIGRNEIEMPSGKGMNSPININHSLTLGHIVEACERTPHVLPVPISIVICVTDVKGENM